MHLIKGTFKFQGGNFSQLGNIYGCILRSIAAHISIKTVLKWSNSSELQTPSCGLPCSELKNPYYILGPQTTHLGCLFFRSIRFLNLCAFLSLVAVATHAVPAILKFPVWMRIPRSSLTGSDTTGQSYFWPGILLLIYLINRWSSVDTNGYAFLYH